MDRLSELRELRHLAEVAQLKHTEASNAASALRERITVLCEEAEGRPESKAARWARAWLEGRFSDCDAISREIAPLGGSRADSPLVAVREG